MLAGDAAMLWDLHARISTSHRVPARTAVTYMAGWIGGVLADAVGFALGTSGAGFLVRPPQIRWRQHLDGWMDRVELGQATVVVPPDHPWAGQAAVEVVSGSQEVGLLAVRALVDLLDPFIQACHGLARVNRAGLWNEVADGLGMALALQARLPAHPDALGRLATALRCAEAPWTRCPRLRLVGSRLGTVHVAQKGGCCLAFTRPADAVPALEALDDAGRAYRQRFPLDDPGKRYCSTCRFRDPADCEARQLYWLERELAKSRNETPREGR